MNPFAECFVPALFFCAYAATVVFWDRIAAFLTPTTKRQKRDGQQTGQLVYRAKLDGEYGTFGEERLFEVEYGTQMVMGPESGSAV